MTTATAKRYTEPQWCELHLGTCTTSDIHLVRRPVAFEPAFENIYVCSECLKTLRDWGVLATCTFAGQPCWALTVTLPTHPQGESRPYEVQLTQPQVVLLRALGFEILEDNDSA